MSRRANLVKALVSGYGLIAVSIVYSLVSVPLALHYLGKTQFGIWAFITQIGSYWALIDLGMSGSVQRILIDFKDEKRGGMYGSVLKTGLAVAAAQGVIIAGVGSALSPLLVHTLPVPPELRQTFVRLLIAQNICLGFFQPFLVFSNVLLAHQRYDHSNLTQVLSLCTGLFTLWMGFHFGFGIYALLLALFSSSLVSAIATILLCGFLKLLPPSGAWGKVTRPVYSQLFGFGLELFIQNLGGQLLNASQVLVISGFIGFDAAATYVVCTKTFTLAQQLVGRIFDFSASALSELFARGESARLRKRFTDVLLLTGGSGILAGLTAAACNHSFVSVWTHGKVSWSPLNDWLFGALTVAISINRTYGGIAWILKNTRKTRYIYFVEGVAFVALGAALASRFGIPGILLAALVADCGISGVYGLRITAEALGASPKEFIREALQPAVRYFLVFTPIALLVWALNSRWKPLFQLCTNAIVLAVVGSLLFRLLALSPALRSEIEQMLLRFRRRVAGEPQG